MSTDTAIYLLGASIVLTLGSAAHELRLIRIILEGMLRNGVKRREW